MYTASQNVHNPTSRPMNLVLEPWANVYSIRPRHTWVVTFRSPKRGTFELVREPQGITLYAWPGCTAQLSERGVVVETLDTPALSVATGTTMRAYVESTYGPHPAQRP